MPDPLREFADAGLEIVFRDLATAPELYRPSPYWEEMTRVNLQQLSAGGFDQFKRSVNMTYFNWSPIGILHHQWLPMFWHWCRQPTASTWRARMAPSNARSADNFEVTHNRLPVPAVASIGRVGAVLYRTYVAMLCDYVRRIDTLQLLDQLSEPAIGNPFLVTYRGRDISQDLCNSVHEFYSARGPQWINKGGGHLAELGSGYGRLAYVFLSVCPDATYTIIDIPPALNVAQKYLSSIFPAERVFRYRPFTAFDSVRDEFEASRVRFLASHQIERVPAKYFDLFINVSSLHEMTLPQIRNYLGQIERTCRGLFYTKQWRRARTAINGHQITERDYPIPPQWRAQYHERHPIQSLFFHALYSIPSWP